jgi:hypothetical protein
MACGLSSGTQFHRVIYGSYNDGVIQRRSLFVENQLQRMRQEVLVAYFGQFPGIWSECDRVVG